MQNVFETVILKNVHMDMEFVFDDKNTNWVPNEEHNRFFLTMHQNMFNDKLQAFGVVFLNEILSSIGIDRTVAGQLVGWSVNGDPGFIDFGIREGVDKFYLTFNVQGVIVESLKTEDPTPDPEAKSPTQMAIDVIAEDSIKLRERLLLNFTQDPGLLATFGPDFVLELGESELWTEDRRDLDSFDLQITQKMRFTRRRDQDLKDHALRQTPEGNLESV